MLRTIFALIIFSCSFAAIGQDLHYSFYQFAPLTVNPALAGAFSGSYRVNGIYSQKQAALSARPYNTFTLSADSPIIKGLRKRDWIGVGIELSTFDELNNSGLVLDPNTGNAATGGFQAWNTFKIGLAYHLALDKKQSQIFTIGAQYGNNNRKFVGIDQKDGRVFPVGNTKDLDIDAFNKRLMDSNNTTNKLSVPFTDMVFGILYNQRSKTSDLKLGFAVEGITRPNTTVENLAVNELKYIGLNIHGAYEMAINKQLRIIPGAYFYSLGPANGLNINTHAHYKINPEKDIILKGGLGIRNLRAVSLYVGAQIKGIDVGAAYDFDVSSAAIGSKSVGGFEIAASYIGLVYKKPKVKPEVFCPRL